MKKLYNFRLPIDLVSKVDELNGSRTFNVTTALQEYIKGDTRTNYNVDMYDLLNNQILDLKNDKKYLQEQVNTLMVAKIPFLAKIKLKLLEGKSRAKEGEYSEH